MKIVEWSETRAVDEKGKEYIDLTAGGVFAAMFGPASEVVKTAVARVDHFCSYAPHYGNYWRDRYYELLRDFTGFESAVAFCEGTVAVEAFWRAARAYTGRPGIWGGLCDPDNVGKGGIGSPSDQFHGWTLGAMVAAGKINYPGLGIWTELGDGRFGTDPSRTSGMIMGPYHAPSGQFHRVDPTINRIKEQKRLYPDILFCVDEIQGGFGRTGKFWAHEHYDDLKPEFVAAGKLAFGGFPGAVLLGPQEVMESASVAEFGHLNSTHSGHPMVCSVGIAVIEEMIAQDLINESARKGEALHRALASFPVRTHGKGLMAGLEFQSRGECKRAFDLFCKHGLLVIDTGRQWIKLGPALIIDDETLARGLSILREIVEEVVHERKPEACGNSGEVNQKVGADLSGDGIPALEAGEIGSPEDARQEGPDY
uniref:Putative aminotransferase n=1 Tax=viral metagenome TaxID=1070528 RepID=A0A6M3LB12_9ZZZZ